MKKWIALALLVGGASYAFSRPRCGRAEALECPAAELEEGVGLRLRATEECPSAGYLCDENRQLQVLRFPLDKGFLRVRVSLPDFLEAEAARQVRTEVVNGINAWNGHPFPLSIDTSALLLRIPDVEVVWTQGLPGSTLGRSTSSVEYDGKRIEYSSDGIAVLVPAQFTMGPRFRAQMLQAGMHEMGHALGLPHSNDEADIMFPRLREAAVFRRISARDRRSVEALYSLPNGARIQ